MSLHWRYVRRQTYHGFTMRHNFSFPDPSWLVWGRASRHQILATFPWIDNCLKMTKLLKVGCLPYSVGRQPSIPLINLGRTWTLNWGWWWLLILLAVFCPRTTCHGSIMVTTSDFQSGRLGSSPCRDHYSMRLDRGTGLIRAFIPPG